MNLLRCASLVVRGSLKQYTDTPPVLDRFKKWFLYGISGGASYVYSRRLNINEGIIGLVRNSGSRGSGKSMELVTKLIWILIPVFGMARYVFWVEISQQSRSFGFVFKDKISKGYHFKKHSLCSLLPDNKASSPLLFTPPGQVLAFS